MQAKSQGWGFAAIAKGHTLDKWIDKLTMPLKGKSQLCKHSAEITQSQSQSEQVQSSSMLNALEIWLMQKERLVANLESNHWWLADRKKEEREEKEQEHREDEEEKWQTVSAINNLHIELSTL